MGAIRYHEHTPGPALRRFVRCVWTLESGPDHAPTAEDRVLPDGCAEIVLHHGAAFERRGAGDERFTTQHRHAVVGQIPSALALRPLGVVGVVGIRLEPWAVGPFLGAAAHELTGRSFALEDVWGGAAAALIDAAHAPGGGGRVVSVLRALEARAAAVRAPRRDVVEASDRMATAAACAAPDATDGHGGAVRRVCRDVGVTGRSLERRFRDDVGVPPKLLARILRFRRAVEMLRSAATPSLAGTAVACGYSDQAHLTRDFREFAGEPPGRWLRADHDLAAVF